MQIICIAPRGFGSNTYVITADNQTAIVIDPSQPRVKEELDRLGLTAKYVLLTHCHFDHVGGVAILQQAGAKVLCSQQEQPLVGTNADLFDMFGAPRVPFTVDDTLQDNQELVLQNINVKTLLTPGHTKGSVCYLITGNDGGRYLFTGDTLFCDSIGRTDFPTGNLAVLQQSLRRLMALDDMPIYPGHNEESTIAQEKQYNPFLGDL